MNDAPIPPDVYDKIMDIELLLEQDFSDEATELIATALIAERQRCLDVAEIEMKVNLSDRIPAEFADQILSAIRRGSS